MPTEGGSSVALEARARRRAPLLLLLVVAVALRSQGAMGEDTATLAVSLAEGVSTRCVDMAMASWEQ
jgi:hypothetical protein